MAQDRFAAHLLNWFDQHGRSDLPWQTERTAYRVWVSEIMLQQTQVATVIPYYHRFMQRFPNVAVLAAATLDEVLHLWTGLGYYARARNLHKAAVMIVQQHQGSFPTEMDAALALPGIGRSTAGAILALVFAQRYPVLDGNVKRVLSRYHGIAGWHGTRIVTNKLWSYAAQHTPTTAIAKYTQAIMDLGAIVCTYRNPACMSCPLQQDCKAKILMLQHDLPSPKPKTKKPERETIFAIMENNKGEVLLEKRPSSGIWGGLWCFPEIGVAESIANTIKTQYGYKVKTEIEYQSFKHTFTHYRLLIKPIHIKIDGRSTRATGKANKNILWLNASSDFNLGLPAPVVSLLKDVKIGIMSTNKITHEVII